MGVALMSVSFMTGAGVMEASTKTEPGAETEGALDSQERSQARYRMAAWITALAVGTAVLLLPSAAHFEIEACLSSAPSVLVVAVLL